MRWPKKHPDLREERLIRKFLWRPLTLDGETRWLEYAYILQRFEGDAEEAEWKNIIWKNM